MFHHFWFRDKNVTGSFQTIQRDDNKRSHIFFLSHLSGPIFYALSKDIIESFETLLLGLEKLFKFSLLKVNQFQKYYGISSRIVFICFLGELKTSKGHFEINLLLLCKSVLQKCAYMFVSTSIFWLNYYLKHFWKAVLNKDMLWD